MHKKVKSNLVVYTDDEIKLQEIVKPMTIVFI